MNDSTPSPPAWLALDGDERLWLRASPSRNLVLAALAVGFVLLLVMSVAVSAMNDLGTGRAVSLSVLLLIVGLLLAAFVATKRAEYVITSDRVCAAIGLRSKRVETVPVERVRAVTVEQSTWQRLANVGTLRFVGDGEELTFSLVGNPRFVQEKAFEIVDP